MAAAEPSFRPAPASPTWTRAEVLAVGAVLVLALGLRVAHVLGSRASPLFDAPQMDALYHLQWARAFAAGEVYQPGPFFRAPLYPWMLGTLLRLFGDGLLLPRLVQAFLGTTTTLLVLLTARRAFGRPAGFVAGLLWATCWVGIFFDGELLLETLAIPLYMLGLWLSLALADRPTPRRALAAGLVWGLSAITRPNVLLCMPLLAVWLLLRARTRGWRALAAPAALTVGTLLPVLPISAYNAMAGDDLVLISSEAGMCLWIGNNPRSDGSTAIVPGTRQDWWGGIHDANALAELAEGRPLRPSEVSQHYARRVWAFVRDEPLAWLRLMAHKLRLLTWNAELGNNEEPRFLFERFSPVSFLSPVGFALLFPLGLLGLAITRRGAWARLPLWGFLATYAASVLLFFVNSRFRLPLLPPLAVYAAAALVWLYSTARTGRRRALAVASASIVLLAAVSLAVPGSVGRRSRSNGHLLLASSAAAASDWSAARLELEQAVELDPRSAIAWRAMGSVRRAEGDDSGAELALLAALDLRPDDADALDLLADLLLAQGRSDEALPLAGRLERAEPASGRGAYVEGRVHFDAGDQPAAAAAFERALSRDPRHFGAAYALGRVRRAQGRGVAAAQRFEQALSSPWTPEQRPYALDAWRRSVESWIDAGRVERARKIFALWREEFAGEPIASELRRRL